VNAATATSSRPSPSTSAATGDIGTPWPASGIELTASPGGATGHPGIRSPRAFHAYTRPLIDGVDP
jgi:hypothetical protein